ncbi:tetratricopeptide repeat protein [Metabacillus halosaccharovorans]|uniref:tetratricopeptide repeat protein n=1 Tax=Metabacillus halosaccharovorans TaxID=930124 RepID=UPI00203FA82A|nr:tetratricopeptide repeat protein [Metabacillus halosaccharovorans]MCM3443092.1 tetratricopeptide repeat protein [Metabacillus halosaccharovorans]
MQKYSYNPCQRFIGRTGYIEITDYIPEEEKPQPVFMYYGIGGTGKTSILNHLYKRYQELPHSLVIKLDFSIPEHREKSRALSFLKYQLASKYKMKLPSFDVAYVYYWYKTNPYTPLLREEIPYLEGADLTNDILQNFFSFEPSIVQEVTESLKGLSEDIPLIKIIPKVLKAVSKLNDLKNDTAIKLKNKELTEIITKDAAEILNYLPTYFAKDVNDYIEKFPNENIIILLDTYEELWSGMSIGSFLQKDRWIREVIKLTPKVQWVICGREPLRWKEEDRYWQEHLHDKPVLGFEEPEGVEYLTESGVEESSIQKRIYQTSNVPENLRLLALEYHDIKNVYNRAPQPEDFLEIPDSLSLRFEQHLSKAEKDTLYTLAIPNYWNRQIFQYLTKELSTGLNIFDYKGFTSYSFVQKSVHSSGEEVWSIEKSLRKAVYDTLSTHDPYIIEEVRNTLWEFYKNKFQHRQSEVTRTDFLEYLGLALEFLKRHELIPWFYKEIKDVLIDYGNAELAVTMYEIIIEKGVDNRNKQQLYVVAHADLASLYEQTGNIDMAENLYKSSIEMAKDVEDKLTLKTNLASLWSEYHHHFNKLVEIEKIYKDNLEELERIGKEHFISLYVANKEGLAILYIEDFGDYEIKQKALNMLYEVLELKEQYLDEAQAASTLHNIAKAKIEGISLYANGLNGMIKNMSIKEDYLTILKLYKSIYGLHDHRTAELFYSMGVYYLTLGSNMAALRTYKLKALNLFKKSEEIYHKLNGQEHKPALARVYAGLGKWYTSHHQFDLAIDKYNEAIVIFEELYGPFYDEISIILNDMGITYMHKKKWKEARLSFERSIEIVETLYYEYHPKSALARLNLGKLYAERKSYRKAFKIFNTLQTKLNERDPLYLDMLRAYKNYYWKSCKGMMDDKYEELVSEISRVRRLIG